VSSTPNAAEAGTFTLGDRTINRLGYGAMRLSGPAIMGPPADRGEALAVLRAAIEAGVNHIDTSDYYGPYLVNELIAEALYPYPEDLVLVTKVGARRTPDGGWPSALSPSELVSAVEDNLRRLRVEAMEVVNLRMSGPDGALFHGDLSEQFGVLAELREQGKIRHLGVSHVGPEQVAQAQAIAPVVCVQNAYNLAHRADDALIDSLAGQDIAYTPFFPLGGFAPLQSAKLDSLADRVGATPMQLALAWLLRRSPNILLIPGTSSRGHLAENLAAGQVAARVDDQTWAELDAF
jgi:pyridoxine 4-dehydrogenase